MVKTKKEKKEGKFEASIPLYNMKGKEVGVFELPKDIFDGSVSKSALYQFVRSYNANQRQGTASTKTISEVSGGGKKPWAQKGTGRARAGTIRSPLWRGGGIIFGPHPRDYHYQLPKKIKRLALISELNSKIKEKDLIGVESLNVEEPKTKAFKGILKALKLSGKTLFIVDHPDENAIRASRNLREVTFRDYKNFNTMDLIANDKVVMTKAVLEKLARRTQRLRHPPVFQEKKLVERGKD